MVPRGEIPGDKSNDNLIYLLTLRLLLHWHPHQRDVPVVADLAVCAPVLPHDVGVTEGLPLELAGHSPGPEV